LLSRASDMRSTLVLALLVAATQVSFLRSKASLLIHRWPLQQPEKMCLGPGAIGYWLLAVVCCLLSVACCLLSIGYWLLASVYCLLSIVNCLLSTGCWLAIGQRSRSSAPPKKHGPRACLSQAPTKRQARGLRLSPSRSTACRRDPRRRRAQHPSCYLRQSPRRRQTHWPLHWRVTSNWPPPPCPLHGATQPLPTFPPR
jgi:hypothetical protein